MARNRLLELAGDELAFAGDRFRVPIPEPLKPGTTDRWILEQIVELIQQVRVDSYFRHRPEEDDDDVRPDR